MITTCIKHKPQREKPGIIHVSKSCFPQCPYIHSVTVFNVDVSKSNDMPSPCVTDGLKGRINI